MNIEELNTQLEYLGETKGLIKQAIINKGQDIGENDTFRSFVQKINDIETGIDTANIPIWYSEADISTSNPIEYEIENKTPIRAWVMDKTTQLTRVDDYSTIRTIPEVGDLYIAISGFSRNNATEYYICLYQIEEVTESGNELNLVVIPLVGERQDNFCTAIGLNTNVLKSGTTILGVQGKSTIVDTEEDNNAATSNDMASGKTAYVNGQKITGSIAGNNANPVTAGSRPTISDDGSNINVDRGYGKKFILNADQQLRSSISYSDMANLINLTADKIKSGVTILGITGTYSDAMKSYNSETAMNNDIANIQEGEVVKVVVTSGIAGDVDNPLTTTTTHYIKETTMKKLVKEEDTISPQEYEENVNLADDILGTE